jgi:hypothetical protein
MAYCDEEYDKFTASALQQYRRPTSPSPALRTRGRVQQYTPVDTHYTYSVGEEHAPQYHERPSYARPVLLCLGISIFTIFAAALVFFLVLLSNSSNSSNSTSTAIVPTASEISAASPVQLSSKFKDLNIYYYQFKSETHLQSRVRYPAQGSIPNISIDTLVDYDVCCVSKSQRFICAGSTAFSGNGIFMESYLEEKDDEIYLLLWVNSEDLIEVGCWLSSTSVS